MVEHRRWGGPSPGEHLKRVKTPRWITAVCTRCAKTTDAHFEACRTCSRKLCDACVQAGCCGVVPACVKQPEPSRAVSVLRRIDPATGALLLDEHVERINFRVVVGLFQNLGAARAVPWLMEIARSDKIPVYVNHNVILVAPSELIRVPMSALRRAQENDETPSGLVASL